MDAAMTFDWIEARRQPTAQTRFVHEGGAARLARDNARLIEENERLRQQCADLTASAELWVRLYEAALARANSCDWSRARHERRGAT
jgi:hypothetical protein